MAREYKDSGIEWIGQIPKEWRIGKIKNFYSLQTGFTPDTKNEMYYDEQGALWANIADIGREHYIDDTKKKISNLYISKYNPNIVPKGSLLYSFKLSVGSVAIAAKDMYTNEAIAAFIKKDGISLSFLYYSSQVCIIFNANENIYGAKILNQDLINNAIIIFPPLLIQQKIADYLDKVCGEADEIISLQEKMIEELKAYKQSIITEAVTKGLNPNVPMKNSGIDWIGEIPEHWKTTKIKKIATTNSGSTPRKISNSEGSNIVWIRTTDINDNIVYDSSLHLTNEEFSSASCPMLKSGTCVVAMYGGGGTIGKSGILGATATINQALCSMEVNDSYFAQYLFCVLKSVRYYWMKYAVGTRKDPNINQEIVRNLNIPFPLIEEQRQIASFLDTKCSEIDSLIAIKQQKIAELKEYKKSVIYEYVTGKKEVV